MSWQGIAVIAALLLISVALTVAAYLSQRDKYESRKNFDPRDYE